MGLRDSPKTIRLLELLLVIGVAFGGPLYFSFYYFVFGLTTTSSPSQHGYGVMTELLGLSVMAYVLFRQGRGPGDIGLSFSGRDLPRALLIAVVGYAAYCVFYLVLYYAGAAAAGAEPGSPEIAQGVFGTEFHWILLVLLFINPFFEELIVRAYLMTEVKGLTGSAVIAVTVSVAVQTLYHLYQGALMALTEAGLFLVFSLYFGRWGRIMPVVLAHLLFDLMAWSFYFWGGEK